MCLPHISDVHHDDLLGVAGYGNTTWAIDQSFADNAVLDPIIYDPSAASGKRWSRDGLSASTIPRMYHSSATLLPDGMHPMHTGAQGFTHTDFLDRVGLGLRLQP